MSIIVGPDGTRYQGEDLDFEIKAEGWSIYSLSDGTTLRVRVVAQKISRALAPDGTMFHKEDGEPLYNVRFQTVVSAAIPENMLAKGAK